MTVQLPGGGMDPDLLQFPLALMWPEPTKTLLSKVLHLIATVLSRLLDFLGFAGNPNFPVTA